MPEKPVEGVVCSTPDTKLDFPTSHFLQPTSRISAKPTNRARAARLLYGLVTTNKAVRSAQYEVRSDEWLVASNQRLVVNQVSSGRTWLLFIVLA